MTSTAASNGGGSPSSSSALAQTTSSGSNAVSKTEPVGVGAEEDEVKVFRSSAMQDDDPNELAGSSAELNADKQELALEADLESQTVDFSQRVNPIMNAFPPLPWPSPGSNTLLNMFATYAALSSPVYAQAAAVQVQQRLAVQAYAAQMVANVAKQSPNYFNLAGAMAGAAAANPFVRVAAFERPPAFSLSQPCTPSTNRNAGGPLGHLQQQQNGAGPQASLGGVFGGISMSADRAAAANGQQRHQQGTAKTPKREKAERRAEKQAGKQAAADKKADHIKKPMNAFMLFMKENRHKYMEQSGEKRKQSAELNKELGQIWQNLNRAEQQPYYDLAHAKKEEHLRLYPHWTARENYAVHKKAKKRRTRERSLENNEQKKCRARFGVDNQAKWCKHCRRKKRCLNVRDSNSPVQVSSTTNPTTPLSLGHLGSGQFGGGLGMFSSQANNGGQSMDSPQSSCPTKMESNSELSRCSSASSASSSSSTDSRVSADEGQHQQQQRTLLDSAGSNSRKRPHHQQHQQQQTPGGIKQDHQQLIRQHQQQNGNGNNGFKLEAPANTPTKPGPTSLAQPPHQLPKPVPNLLMSPQQSAFHQMSSAAAAVAGAANAFPFPQHQNPFMPFGFNFPPFATKP